MNKIIVNQLVESLKIKEKQINEVLNLLEQGSTVPFIARYRKEVTGSLDEDVIRTIEKQYKYELNVFERRIEIKRLIEEKKLLTPELELQLDNAKKLQELEDLYLPFKEKRKTKATEAIKFGLQPLADYILSFPEVDNLFDEATKFINEDITSEEQAIDGAGFIIAEIISENAKNREFVRNYYKNNAIYVSTAKKDISEIDVKAKYEMYYDFSISIKKIKSYQILATNRAEKEKVVSIKFDVDFDKIILQMERNILKPSPLSMYVQTFIEDSLKRLICPSIERELRKDLTLMADETAIKTFSSNLDNLIMQPPLKNKIVLAIDPAFRTGCKLAIVDQNAKVLYIGVIYPTMPKNEIEKSSKVLMKLISDFKVEQIVIGNGTASRETEKFVNDFKNSNKLQVEVSIVSEAGASVYSASKLAQLEFPDLEVEKRSAISIARRVIDPMAELVKIDPKSIGVGQYQHDVNQNILSENLDFVMLKTINSVGVDINTASAELLKYVSGLDKTIAKNIVSYREENGKFNSRTEILSVKRLGPKAYEQCAGFLKILSGEEKFDETFIHPESYNDAQKIIDYLNIAEYKLGSTEINEVLDNLNIKEISENLDLSEIFISDIIKSFRTPNIDIRENIKVANFSNKVQKISDLTVSMEVEGQVRNIVEFGAFVDIGLKNDALIHISQITNKKFINDVSDVLSIGDVLSFKVKDVDEDRGRIQLTLLDEVN